jgi:hypothetical protein
MPSSAACVVRSRPRATQVRLPRRVDLALGDPGGLHPLSKGGERTLRRARKRRRCAAGRRFRSASVSGRGGVVVSRPVLTCTGGRVVVVGGGDGERGGGGWRTRYRTPFSRRSRPSREEAGVIGRHAIVDWRAALPEQRHACVARRKPCGHHRRSRSVCHCSGESRSIDGRVRRRGKRRQPGAGAPVEPAAAAGRGAVRAEERRAAELGPVARGSPSAAEAPAQRCRRGRSGYVGQNLQRCCTARRRRTHGRRRSAGCRRTRTMRTCCTAHSCWSPSRSSTAPPADSPR